MTVMDEINTLRSNNSIKRINVIIEAASTIGYLVKIEYDKVSASGHVMRYYREFLVEGDGLNDNEVLNAPNYWEVNIDVKNGYRLIWNTSKRRRRW